MRLKSTTPYFNFTETSSLKVVDEYIQKYQRIRDTIIQIDTSDVLKFFAHLTPGKTMDYTFLNKAFCALAPETVENMVAILADYACHEQLISGDKQRMDTTAYETNIHYPTDSSLLWDSFRTLTRLLRQTLKGLPQLELHHRFHDKKVKKLAVYIARNASSKRKSTQRQVKRYYRLLIQRVHWIHGVGQHIYNQASQAGYDLSALAHYLTFGGTNHRSSEPTRPPGRKSPTGCKALQPV